MNVTDILDLVPTLRWVLLVFNTCVHMVEGKVFAWSEYLRKFWRLVFSDHRKTLEGRIPALPRLYSFICIIIGAREQSVH